MNPINILLLGILFTAAYMYGAFKLGQFFIRFDGEDNTGMQEAFYMVINMYLVLPFIGGCFVVIYEGLKQWGIL